MHYAATLDIDATFLGTSFMRAVLMVWLPFIFIPISVVQFIDVL